MEKVGRKAKLSGTAEFSVSGKIVLGRFFIGTLCRHLIIFLNRKEGNPMSNYKNYRDFDTYLKHFPDEKGWILVIRPKT